MWGPVISLPWPGGRVSGFITGKTTNSPDSPVDMAVGQNQTGGPTDVVTSFATWWTVLTGPHLFVPYAVASTAAHPHEMSFLQPVGWRHQEYVP